MLSEDNAIMRFELKYCEQCGALWLRGRDEKSNYCAFCGQLHELLPTREADNRRRGCSGPRRRKQARAQRRLEKANRERMRAHTSGRTEGQER